MATAKTGASVESDPSISPVIAGCTRWSRKERSAAASLDAAVASAGDM